MKHLYHRQSSSRSQAISLTHCQRRAIANPRQPIWFAMFILVMGLSLSACGRVSSITTSSGTTASGDGAATQEDASAGDATAQESSTEAASSSPKTVGDIAEIPVSKSPLSEPPAFNPETTEIGLQPVVDGLNQPVYVTSANDGSDRLFVVEQPGFIQIFANGGLLPTPFLDIEARVGSSGFEQGLLGLAFAPNFGETGHAYVNYTNLDGTTIVSRFSLLTDDANQLDPNSEFVVLTLPQPAQNHNGGMVLFGPDGYLYIGTGDGGAANDRFENGQNPSALLGKMLRIDVTSDPSQPYLIPTDNPWIDNDWMIDGDSVDVLDEIWAVGLRNPWRYSFDRATGDLWIADVGQNQYEEVNFVAASTLASGPENGSIQAMNFGWPIMEASECFAAIGGCESSGLVLPVAAYDHSGHCSVTGGYVYRGQQFPILQGVYLYADFCSGVVWAIMPDGSGGWSNSEVLQSGLSISSFGEDEQGELYITALGGTVHQVTAVEK